MVAEVGAGLSGLTAGLWLGLLGQPIEGAPRQMSDICAKFFMIVAIREFLCPGLSVTAFTQGIGSNCTKPSGCNTLLPA